MISKYYFFDCQYLWKIPVCKGIKKNTNYNISDQIMQKVL